MPSVQSHIYRQVARLLSAYTDRALVSSLEDFRRASLRGLSTPRGSMIEPVLAAGVPCEWIRAPGQDRSRVILYLHGGGWVLGWGDAHRRMVALLGQMAGAAVLAPDYRLAPEHPFPAALEDCVAVYRWLLDGGQKPESIAIAGDSAGGNLTVTVMLALRDAGVPLPARAVCISPAADLTGPQGRPRNDPLLSAKSGSFMAGAYLSGQDPTNPLISPVYADLHGLPPLLIHIGELESLRGGAERLAARAREAGVPVTLEVWSRMWHVWHAFAPILPEAQAALEEVARFIRQEPAPVLCNRDLVRWLP